MAEHTVRDIVEYYKKKKGYNEQPNWDTFHFKRHVRIALDLWNMANIDWKDAINYTADKLDPVKMPWTLETVFKQYPDYLKIKKSDKVKKLEELIANEKA